MNIVGLLDCVTIVHVSPKVWHDRSGQDFDRICTEPVKLGELRQHVYIPKKDSVASIPSKSLCILGLPVHNSTLTGPRRFCRRKMI